MKTRPLPNDTGKPTLRRRGLRMVLTIAAVTAATAVVALYPPVAAPIGAGAAVATLVVPYLRRN
ncbi:hypothetical protein [Kitasatospora sp. NPDC058218]|uniref:hypothetical protein n=1 Tax=Kitasatospora sp. NPDC058218 TaxID=3346385 RepID=UPI0036DF8514